MDDAIKALFLINTGADLWVFVKRFSDTVLLLENNINLHERNIIKLQSLIHKLSSSRYHNLFKYLWFKSDYTNERPEEFEDSVEFSFNKSSTTCEIEGCSNIAVVKCL